MPNTSAVNPAAMARIRRRSKRSASLPVKVQARVKLREPAVPMNPSSTTEAPRSRALRGTAKDTRPVQKSHNESGREEEVVGTLEHGLRMTPGGLGGGRRLHPRVYDRLRCVVPREK